ncbi:conserved hypothetical protein [uncultured Defluviicoccus sp.]|uniref:Uncharacterized protein n=1 Tax=metagenome TaxID=256318 RepID=A0A380THH9_9ZZZZ|nr:conserved hypothetical protein [uncultured Defluviicoccus sp.]
MTTTILPTTNETWGFWGSMGHAEADQSQAWALTSTAIAKATDGTPEAMRTFLDSRQGRHFADAEPAPAIGPRGQAKASELFNGRTLAEAVNAAVATWIA